MYHTKRRKSIRSCLATQSKPSFGVATYLAIISPVEWWFKSRNRKACTFCRSKGVALSLNLFYKEGKNGIHYIFCEDCKLELEQSVERYFLFRELLRELDLVSELKDYIKTLYTSHYFTVTQSTLALIKSERRDREAKFFEEFSMMVEKDKEFAEACTAFFEQSSHKTLHNLEQFYLEWKKLK